MAESVLDIYNGALLRLGHSPLSSLINPQGETGIALGKPTKITLCNGIYPRVRDATLRAYPWNCAIERQQLATQSVGPVSRFTYYYTLPVDPYCLRVLDLDDEDAIFKIEGRRLATDNTSVIARFIARITDVSLFDPLLEEAMTARLASELAYPIAGSVNLAQEMWQLYAAKIQEAKTIDGMEGTVEALTDSTLTDVRL